MSVEKPGKETNNASFFEIDAKTRASLNEFAPLVERMLPTILKDFYAHVGKHGELAQLFGSDAAEQSHRMAHASAAQEKHWVNLFAGRFDATYITSLRKIGLAHAQRGVEPRWYIGGYSFVLNRLCELAVRQYSQAGNREVVVQKTTDMIRAINQAVMLDMALAISVYNDENKNTATSAPGQLQDMAAALQQIIAALGAASQGIDGQIEALGKLTDGIKKV